MLVALAVLGLLAALPVAAQAQTSWTGANLSVSGNRSNGCDLRAVEVSHSGGTLNSLRFAIANRAASTARATAEITMTGDNQSKRGTIAGVIAANQQATLIGFHPFGGSLAGSRVQIRFVSCTPG